MEGDRALHKGDGVRRKLIVAVYSVEVRDKNI